MADTNSRLPDADSAPPDSMFERTTAGVIGFLGRALRTTGIALVTPLKLATLAGEHDRRLAPPLSFLTLGLFLAGISVRLFQQQKYGVAGENEHLTSDLKEILLQTSLWEVMVMTFPCILFVVVIGSLLAWAAGARERFDRNPVVAVTCYSASFQFLALGGLGLAIVLIRLLISPPGEPALHHNTIKNLLLGVFFFGFGSSTLMIACSIAQAGTRRYVRSWLVRYPLGFWASLLMMTSCMSVIQTSFDFQQAKALASARRVRHWHAGLRVNVLEHRQRAMVGSHPDHVIATLAMTNLTERPLIVPRHRELIPADVRTPLDSVKPAEGPPVRVVASSIDDLPDRALVIEAGKTRVVEIEVAMPPQLAAKKPTAHWTPLVFPFRQPDEDCYYETVENLLYLPPPVLRESGIAARPKGQQSAQRQ